MCRDILPKQLEGFLNYVAYFSFMLSHLYTTGFAYYDEILYRPKDMKECTLLTLSLTISDKPVSFEQKYHVNLKINFTL
jgi:hypothetical protein